MSNVKRKDNKGRNLRLGESQRKDGRYVYKYTDIYGKPQFKYAPPLLCVLWKQTDGSGKAPLVSQPISFL